MVFPNCADSVKNLSRSFWFMWGRKRTVRRMEVYVRRGEEQFGPFSPEQFEECLASGSLIEGDLAWHKGLKDWVSASEVPGTFRPAASPVEETSAPGSGCGRPSNS